MICANIHTYEYLFYNIKSNINSNTLLNTSCKSLCLQDTHQPTNPPTHQPTNPPTHQPTNPPTQQPINPSTHQPINPTTQQPNNPSTHQPNNPTTHHVSFLLLPHDTSLPSGLGKGTSWLWHLTYLTNYVHRPKCRRSN